MSSERPRKKAKTTKDADVSVGGSSPGGIHLTPELVARVATFADAVNSPDVMNICLAVGPDTSRTVRRNYLRRNTKYLNDSVCRLSRRISNTNQMTNEMVCDKEKARSNHLAWMKVNSDWRTIAVRDDLIMESKIKQPSKKIGPSVLGHIVHPFLAFNNPAVAIQIRLFDSLKHLVEEKGIDINSFEWTPLGSTERMHLLYYAASLGHEMKIFKYLLNRPGFDLRCKANEKDRGNSLFLCLLCVVTSTSRESGRLYHPFLKMFMQHSEFQINERIIPGTSGESSFITPLHAATMLCLRLLTERGDNFDEMTFQATHQGTQVLLLAGADPNLGFPDSSAPIVQLKRVKSAAKRGHYPGVSVEDYKARERHWDEAVALLEKYA